jgi:arginase
MDRDAGLNLPATTPSGNLDGMVISHVTGRGAPELVRFWGEPPLIREPDVAVFGIDRIDEPEQKWLARAPLRHYLAADLKGRVAAKAEEALERVHGTRQEFVLLIDLDVIAAEDFAATNTPGSGGLGLNEVRQALAVFARQPKLAALVVAGYNPTRDTQGNAAKIVIDLLLETLSPRLEVASAPPEGAAAAPAEATADVSTAEPAAHPAAPAPEPITQAATEEAAPGTPAENEVPGE